MSLNPSAVLCLDAAEMEHLAGLSGKSGMAESDYIRCVLEHALECGCTFVKYRAVRRGGAKLNERKEDT